MERLFNDGFKLQDGDVIHKKSIIHSKIYQSVGSNSEQSLKSVHHGN